MTSKRYQFGLASLFWLILIAALACWASQLDDPFAGLVHIALAATASVAVVRRTVWKSVLWGGLSASIVPWLYLTISVIQQYPPSIYHLARDPWLFLIAGICSTAFSFILGAVVGGAVGLARQAGSNDVRQEDPVSPDV